MELKQKIKKIMELKYLEEDMIMEHKQKMNEDYGTKVSRRRYNYGTKVEN